MADRRKFLKAASLVSLGMMDSVSTGVGQQLSPPAADDSTLPPPGPVTFPQSPPVKEQDFPDLHLLGKPDKEANLLGLSRPHDWKTTKGELESALNSSAHGDDPIHEWLKTFAQTFDEHSAAIVLSSTTNVHKNGNSGPLTYEPQLYESLLRSSAGLLDRCLRYRVEMGSFEVAGISAGINYLAFLKLRPLQYNFLIQSSSADIADIERLTQEAASQRYHAVKGLDKLFDKYHLQGLQIESQGSAEEAGLSGAKDRLRTHLLQKQFHINVDVQLAQFTRLLTSGSSSNFAERYLRMLSLVIEDLSDSYRKLFSASKGIQQVLGLTKVTVGTGTPIDVDIPLFDNETALREWVRKVVPQQGSQRQADVLDAFVLWTRAVMRELDRRAQYETEFTVTIPLNQPWGKSNSVIVPQSAIQAAFNGAQPTGKVTFALTDDALPFGNAPQSLRITGVGVSVQHAADDASPVQYSESFPAAAVSQPVPTGDQRAAVAKVEKVRMAKLNAIITLPVQTVPSAGSYSRPPLYLSNIRLQVGSDLEPATTFDPAGRNASPFGNWSITFDRNVLTFFQTNDQFPDDWITGIVLHLRLRGSAA
jgi:hypothetical protein